MVPWTHPSPRPKRHLDQFSHFTGLKTVIDRQTDPQTTLLHLKLECGPMPNVMVALPNIGGAFCSMPRRKVRLTPTTTPWVKKGCHPNHGYNFVNSWSICKILSLLQTAVNLQQNSHWVTHHTLSMLLHYLVKLKNQKFALCMHVKHVSSVIFYHLSNRYLPNVMKINVKINTMQNTNILLFVRSLSLTYWRNV